jgi:O-antigen ligase
MVLSLLWSFDLSKSLFGVQKQLSMLFIPIAFFYIPMVNKRTIHGIIRIYSFGMVLFALFFLLKACLRYLEINNTAIFFHDELVPEDPGAIYISVFASLAVFHFIQIQAKSNIDRICIFVITLLIFLLSSKSIITIDFVIVVWYYAFFAKIPANTKTLTILSVTVFLVLSLTYVKEFRQRFLIEYETAFIDNTLNEKLTNQNQSYNVSIKEAWNQNAFQQNSFFPGTALRIHQLRVFSEMVQENPSLIFMGLGLEASQDFISDKANDHHLSPLYAKHNFHNQYIQTLAELGIVGLIILILMLFVNLKNAVKDKDFLHITFAITMLMLFLSESFFCRQRGIVFFILLYCLFNSASNEELEEIKSI